MVATQGDRYAESVVAALMAAVEMVSVGSEPVV
jgi:hypothetical protein